ncbi:MAG: FliO/MopB family protein [Elusimicrobiota bacterium]
MSKLKSVIKIFVFYFLFGILPNPVFSVTVDEPINTEMLLDSLESNSTEKPMAPETSFFSILLRTGCALLIVLALGCVAIKVMKMLRFSPAVKTSSIQIIQRLPLSGRKALYVVKVAEKALILGVSEQAISKICFMNLSDFPDTEAMASAPAGRFGEMLAQKMRSVIGKNEN